MNVSMRGRSDAALEKAHGVLFHVGLGEAPIVVGRGSNNRYNIATMTATGAPSGWTELSVEHFDRDPVFAGPGVGGVMY